MFYLVTLEFGFYHRHFADGTQIDVEYRQLRNLKCIDDYYQIWLALYTASCNLVRVLFAHWLYLILSCRWHVQ